VAGGGGNPSRPQKDDARAEGYFQSDSYFSHRDKTRPLCDMHATYLKKFAFYG
jgi:hypothetical protein